MSRAFVVLEAGPSGETSDEWPAPLPGATNTLGAHAATDLASASMPEDVAVEIFRRAIDNVTRELFAERARPAPDDEDLVLLLRRRSPLWVDLGDPGASAHEVIPLPDGSVLVRTTWNVVAREDLALVLAEWHEAWTDEHDDPRGVPSFAAVRLEQVRAASSYDDVLARLGDETVFVVPRSLSELGVATVPLDELLGFGASDE